MEADIQEARFLSQKSEKPERKETEVDNKGERGVGKRDQQPQLQ